MEPNVPIQMNALAIVSQSQDQNLWDSIGMANSDLDWLVHNLVPWLDNDFLLLKIFLCSSFFFIGQNCKIRKQGFILAITFFQMGVFSYATVPSLFHAKFIVPTFFRSLDWVIDSRVIFFCNFFLSIYSYM